MAEGAGEKRQRKLADVLLWCFCGSACRKEQEQLVPTEGEGIIEEGRGGRPSRAMASDEKPLRKVADTFKELANVVSSESSDVEVAAFCHACTLVAPLIVTCLGIQFKFAEMELVSKVNDLVEASKSFRTLQSMVDQDIQTNSVKKVGSHSRNLLRVKRGLEFVRALFEQILLTEGNSIKEAVSKAYAQTFNSYHGWALRKAVSSAIQYIPTKQQIYRKINEDDTSVRVHMQTYVTASTALLLYIDKIFLSRELGIDW